MKLPVDYTTLTGKERRQIREQYIINQEGKCYYCKEDLKEPPPKRITDKEINLKLFPQGFLDRPIHLQHNHYNGMTEGAVHCYCNAVMWQYEGK